MVRAAAFATGSDIFADDIHRVSGALHGDVEVMDRYGVAGVVIVVGAPGVVDGDLAGRSWFKVRDVENMSTTGTTGDTTARIAPERLVSGLDCHGDRKLAIGFGLGQVSGQLFF